jgi:outer membrane biosynthesis protein TonB
MPWKRNLYRGLFALVAVFPSVALGQGKADESNPNTTREPGCIDRLRVAHDATGSVIVLSVKELNRLAAHRLVPKMPSVCRCEGTVVVKVVVDELGHVVCVVNVTGHPLLLKSVVDALTAWVFRPYSVNGKPTPVVGFLAFHFSTGSVTVDEGVRAMPEGSIHKR